MVVCVDFDGTICEHVYPEVGPAVPGAFEWMKKWQAAGAKLILWTMRSDGRADGSKPLSDAVEFCRKNGIEFYGVNENPDQKSWTLSPKAYGHLYVDDAAFGCPLVKFRNARRPHVDWSVVGPEVLKRLMN